MSILTISTKLNNLARGKAVRFLAWALIIGFVSQLFLFNLGYQAARQHLHNNDPRRLQNRSEMFVYFAPTVLRRGTNINAETVIKNLREIAYAEREGDDEATYSISDNRLKINSRLKRIFPNLVVTFERNRIKEILADNQAVESAQLEPLPMQNFIHFVKDSSVPELRTRRLVLEAGNVPEVVLIAVTAAEDKRFIETIQYYAHHGFDVFATFNRVASGKGGGSTITQQLMKNNVFKGSQNEFWQNSLGFLPERYQRKFFEPMMALAAENMYSKDEILAAYLSMVPYSDIFYSKLIARRIGLWLQLKLNFSPNHVFAALQGHLNPESKLEEIRRKKSGDNFTDDSKTLEKLEKEANLKYKRDMTYLVTSSLSLSAYVTGFELLVEEKYWLKDIIGIREFNSSFELARQIPYFVQIFVERFLDISPNIERELKGKHQDLFVVYGKEENKKVGKLQILGFTDAKEVIESLIKLVSADDEKQGLRKLLTILYKNIEANIGESRRRNEFLDYLSMVSNSLDK